MRFRDIIVILFCIGAVILAGLNEAPVTMHNTFRIPAKDTSGRMLPRPVVADLNGDGRTELLAVGPSDTIAAYATSVLRTWGDIDAHGGGHFAQIAPMHSSVHSSNIIAFTVGPLDRANVTDSHAVAVVTDDYRLEVLDNRMHELWSASILGDDAAAAAIVPAYASVAVHSERIFLNDMGTVVVAVPVADDRHVIACFDGATGEIRWRRVESVNNMNDLSDEEQQRKAYSIDTFKFTAADIEKEPPPLYTALSTFPNLLHMALPHSSEHHWKLELGAGHIYTQKTKKKRHAEHHTDHIAHDDHGAKHGGGDFGDKFGRQLGISQAARRARRKRRRDNNVLLLHLPNQVMVLHYYTGRILTVLDALRKNAHYEDLDGDGAIDEITLQMGGTVQRQFSRHGFEEVARCETTVRRNWPSSHEDPVEIRLCGHSQASFLERLSVPYTVRDSHLRSREMHDQSKLHGYKDDYLRSAESDVASTAPLVLHSVPDSMLTSSAAAARGARTTHSRVLFLLSTGEVAMLLGGQLVATSPKKKSTSENNGGGGEELAHRPWIIPTPSEYHPASAAASDETSADRFGHVDTQMKPHPHLVPYQFHVAQEVRGPLRRAAGNFGATHALAVGSEWISMVNAHTGTVVCTAKLEAEAVAPAIVVDFSGDGVSDVIVATSEGLYGYTVRRHAATSAVGTVMVVVLALFGLLVAARFAESGFGRDAAAASVGVALPGATFSSGADAVSSSADPMAQHQDNVQERIAQRLRSGKRSTD